MKYLLMFIAWIKTVNAFELIKRFYGNLIDLIGFIVDKTSEQGADIAIRALPIVSPLPNAISMYYVSQDALGFNDWQAKAFAAAIELSLFGLFEVVLIMFDGYQRKPKRYEYPLKIAVGVAITIMILIMAVVWWIETKSPVLAALPLFSAAGASALALRRWHNHNEKSDADQKREEIEQKLKIEQLKIEAKIKRRSVAVGVTANEEDSVARNTNTPEKVNPATQRRNTLLQLLQQHGDIGDTAFGEKLNADRTTIYRDFKALEKSGIVHLNGDGWTPGPKH